MKYYNRKVFGSEIFSKAEILTAMTTNAIIIALVTMYDESCGILKLRLPEGCIGLVYKPDYEKSFTYQSLVGNSISIRVLSQRDENTFICERESVLREARQYGIKHLAPGMIIKDVPITGFNGYGAFGDIGDFPALLHVKEMLGEPRHPSEALKLGDKVTVAVKRIDKNKQEVFLTQKLDTKIPFMQRIIDCFM